MIDRMDEDITEEVIWAKNFTFKELLAIFPNIKSAKNKMLGAGPY